MFVGVESMRRTPVAAILVALWLAALAFRSPKPANAMSAARAGAAIVRPEVTIPTSDLKRTNQDQAAAVASGRLDSF